MYQLFTPVIPWLTGSRGPATAQHRATARHQGRKNQNSKQKIWFLPNAHHLRTIVKSKNQKLNHRKLGTIYNLFNSHNYSAVKTNELWTRTAAHMDGSLNH